LTDPPKSSKIWKYNRERDGGANGTEIEGRKKLKGILTAAPSAGIVWEKQKDRDGRIPRPWFGTTKREKWSVPDGPWPR